MKKATVIKILIAILAVALISLVLFGCYCKKGMREGFEMEKEQLDGLSDEERELFKDLKDNNLDDAKIQDLIKGGTLTEEVVDKFISNLQMDSFTGSKDKKKKNMRG